MALFKMLHSSTAALKGLIPSGKDCLFHTKQPTLLKSLSLHHPTKEKALHIRHLQNNSRTIPTMSTYLWKGTRYANDGSPQAAIYAAQALETSGHGVQPKTAYCSDHRLAYTYEAIVDDRTGREGQEYCVVWAHEPFDSTWEPAGNILPEDIDDYEATKAHMDEAANTEPATQPSIVPSTNAADIGLPSQPAAPYGVGVPTAALPPDTIADPGSEEEDAVANADQTFEEDLQVMITDADEMKENTENTGRSKVEAQSAPTSPHWRAEGEMDVITEDTEPWQFEAEEDLMPLSSDAYWMHQQAPADLTTASQEFEAVLNRFIHEDYPNGWAQTAFNEAFGDTARLPSPDASEIMFRDDFFVGAPLGAEEMDVDGDDAQTQMAGLFGQST